MGSEDLANSPRGTLSKQRIDVGNEFCEIDLTLACESRQRGEICDFRFVVGKWLTRVEITGVVQRELAHAS